MHISDLAFEPWIQGKLGNAESTFTQEIIRSSNRDHHALANRALIRARSKRFKEATDDAEKVAFHPLFAFSIPHTSRCQVY